VRKIALLALGLLLFVAPASADIAVTPGSGVTIFDFTCFTSKHCGATAITNSAGVEVTGAAGSPAATALTIQGIGSGQPVVVSGSVSCSNCSGSGVSTIDEATFTAGTSLFAGTGGFFQTTATSNALTNGQQGMFQVTANRALFTNLRTAAGTEIGTSTTPLIASIAQGGSTATVGTYGTAPGAVAALNVNANVTNSNANGQASAANSSPVVGATGTIAGGSTGSAGTAATTVVSVQGIASMTPLLTNPGTAANWALGATAASVPVNAILAGARAQNAEPTAVTNGQLAAVSLGLEGKLINLPYANKENMARGAGSSTSTTAITVLAASGSASLKEYVTDLYCTRNDAGTTAISVTLNDSASTVVDVPNNGGGGGWKFSWHVPLSVAANTAATATPSSGVTTLHCGATGYYGT
jgi:hypothetical protein